MTKYFFLYFLLIFSLTLCGGDSDTSDDDTTDDTSDSINTEKLIGTPFEGLTTGDEFDWEYFLRCGNYRTETIDEIPINIFVAFFTEDEEAIIQEGIDIANTAMGDTFYVLTDEWSNDVRVMYKVENIINEETGIDYGSAGHGNLVESRFNDKTYAETEIPDWQIELTNSGVNKWVVAHELGHATGITGHYLIDYENDTFITLEENSLMESVLPTNPVFTDYNYMMQQQAQIIQDHLGELGNMGVCTE